MASARDPSGRKARTASARDQQDDQHRKAKDDARHDLHRIEPQLIQTGVDDADRDKPHHRPVLDRRTLPS